MKTTTIDSKAFSELIQRIQKQTDYIRELEEANDYKDKVIDELNHKYASGKDMKIHNYEE